MIEFMIYAYAAAFLALLGFLVWRKTTRSRQFLENLDALAAQKGWTVTHDREGQRTSSTISAPDGSWTLYLASSYSTSRRKTVRYHPGKTEMVMARPDWPQGEAVFIGKANGKTIRGLIGGTGLVGALKRGAASTMLSGMVPAGVLDGIERFMVFDPPEDLDLTIFATDDPRALDLHAVQTALHDWQPKRKSRLSKLTAAVIIGPDGLRYRLSDGVTDVADVESFVARGEELAARLNPNLSPRPQPDRSVAEPVPVFREPPGATLRSSP